MYLQSIDSRVAGSTNGPFPFILNLEGSHEFHHKVVTNPTQCNIQPTTTHPETVRSVNVLSCLPEWWYAQDANGNFIPGGNNYQAPPGPITIAIPPQFTPILESIIRAAAADWASLLGRTITVNANATCPANTGSCVTVRADHGTLPGDTGCASLGTSSPDPNGAWTNTMAIRLAPTIWSGANTERLRRMIAHELGHYFGLWNRQDATCPTDSTIMGDAGGGPALPDCYASSPLPPGYTVSPTAGDKSPLVKSTYGNHNRKVCGW